MAFVVMLHLSPKHESDAAGDPPARDAHAGDRRSTGRSRSKPNHVYVIPPDKLLSMADGHLRVTAMRAPRAAGTSRSTCSSARWRRSTASAPSRVVLSGTGADGAVGLARIKEQGGVTLAQRPSDAEYDGMPRAAIAHRRGRLRAAGRRACPTSWSSCGPTPQPSSCPTRRSEGAKVPAPATPRGRQGRRGRALREILAMLRARTGHDFQQLQARHRAAPPRAAPAGARPAATCRPIATTCEASPRRPQRPAAATC